MVCYLITLEEKPKKPGAFLTMLLLRLSSILLFFPMPFSKFAIRMNEHLRIAINSLVEFLVCVRCLLDADLVADDEAGLGFSGNNQITEVAIVPLDVGLARC